MWPSQVKEAITVAALSGLCLVNHETGLHSYYLQNLTTNCTKLSINVIEVLCFLSKVTTATSMVFVCLSGSGI
jgi:hypothetical protein